MQTTSATAVQFPLCFCISLFRFDNVIRWDHGFNLLRLLFGVVLGIVAVLIFTGVDVLATEMLSGSESESWTFGQTGFLFEGAISLSISFWFSASILVKSVIISLLKDVFISSRFSGSILGFLLGPATRFSVVLFSAMEASKSPEASSATAFLF